MWNYFRGESASNRSAFALPPLSPIEQEKGSRARSQVATSPMVFVAQSQVESELAAHSLARSARDVRRPVADQRSRLARMVWWSVGLRVCLAWPLKVPLAQFAYSAGPTCLPTRSPALILRGSLAPFMYGGREHECGKVWRRGGGDSGESAGNPKRTPRLTVALSSAAAQALS